MSNSLSISIVVYGIDEPLFMQVFDSLVSAVDKAAIAGLLDDVTLAVIDNGQDTKKLGLLLKDNSSQSLRTNLIANSHNVGYGQAHNIAIEQSSSDFHLILNPDAVLDSNALVVGLRYLNDNKDVVLVSPYAESPDGRQTHLCKRYPSVLDLLLRGFAPKFVRNMAQARLAHYEYRDLDNSTATKGIQLVSGCCMLCRTHPLKTVGGFGEDYFLYFEDFDLSVKMAKKGVNTYLPDMRIVHHGGNSAQKGFAHIGMFCRSGIRFFRAYGWKLT